MLNRIVFIILIIAAVVGYSVYQKSNLEAQLATKSEAILSKLPYGVFETLDGKPFDPHELYKNRVGLLVVHYWGTWCAPCEAELPELLAFIRRFETRPEVMFLLVAVNDDKVKIQKHLKTLALPKSSVVLLMDNKNIHRDIYGTTRVPETYVFSSDKTTLKKYLGPQDWNKTMFFQSFDEFIQISATKL
jgi:cytochrome c biogenesis protein CcmG, thiol:disulfide interchange protein DsbE